MNRLQFLGQTAIWGALFYLSLFVALYGGTILINSYVSIGIAFLPLCYSFYKLLLSGLKRVEDIFPGKDNGLLLTGFIIVISIIPFGTVLLAVLPGNVLEIFKK